MSADEAQVETGRGYGAGARILSIGLALTGIVTLAFFVLANHALEDPAAYDNVSVLWSVTFLITSVIYRPIEQLLARTLAESRAHGNRSHALRTPATLQLTAAALFVVAALAARDPLTNEVLGGDGDLFWILLAAVTTYSLSYFARGWLAGSGRPELYGVLVFIESTARCLFPIIALLGLTEGPVAVAAGIAAAPLISLAVVPLALRGGLAQAPSAHGDHEAGTTVEAELEAGACAGRTDLSLRSGAVFAGSTVAIMLAEQLLITAGTIAVALDQSGSGVAAIVGVGAAGAVFNAFLVSRAPLQLFQAVQSTLLPHLAGLSARGGASEAARALRVTMLVIAGFAGCVTLGLLLLGPWALDLVFSGKQDYAAGALALIGVGMGLHLAGGTLNQSALAHGRAPRAALIWLLAALTTILWLSLKPIEEPVARAAAGYALSAAVLLVGLAWIERRALRG